MCFNPLLIISLRIDFKQHAELKFLTVGFLEEECALIESHHDLLNLNDIDNA